VPTAQSRLSALPFGSFRQRQYDEPRCACTQRADATCAHPSRNTTVVTQRRLAIRSRCLQCLRVRVRVRAGHIRAGSAEPTATLPPSTSAIECHSARDHRDHLHCRLEELLEPHASATAKLYLYQPVRSPKTPIKHILDRKWGPLHPPVTHMCSATPQTARP
jgi:hypothetical protein